MNREEGITIMLVTHDANVAKYANRTIHIADGVIEDGAGASVVEMAGGRAEGAAR